MLKNYSLKLSTDVLGSFVSSTSCDLNLPFKSVNTVVKKKTHPDLQVLAQVTVNMQEDIVETH
jgi:hypothetical protein